MRADRVAGLPAREKTQGLPSAPLPIITPSHPVCALIRWLSSWQSTSPLPMTGIDTACFTVLITCQSAEPENPWLQVRPCTVTAAAPACSAIRAKSGAVIVSCVQPLRNFTVTGSVVCATTALIISPASSGVFIRADPAPFLVTLRTGHPMLMSIKSASSGLIRAAALPMASGSAPKSCTPRGWSAGALFRRTRVFFCSWTRP